MPNWKLASDWSFPAMLILSVSGVLAGLTRGFAAWALWAVLMVAYAALPFVTKTRS